MAKYLSVEDAEKEKKKQAQKIDATNSNKTGTATGTEVGKLTQNSAMRDAVLSSAQASAKTGLSASKAASITPATTNPYEIPQYSDAYRQGLDVSYYDDANNQYIEQAEQERADQLQKAAQNQQAALKNAYIQKVQNQQRLNQNMTNAGIRGGATETANLRLANTYGQARAAANTDYANSVDSINKSIDQNIKDFTFDTNSQREQYLQNQANAMWQADRENAVNQINWKREDDMNAYQKEQDRLNREQQEREFAYQQELDKINREREDKANAEAKKQEQINYQTDRWSNYYANMFSAWSKKSINNNMATWKKNWSDAVAKGDTYAAIRWQQCISQANARLGVLANKK